MRSRHRRRTMAGAAFIGRLLIQNCRTRSARDRRATEHRISARLHQLLPCWPSCVHLAFYSWGRSFILAVLALASTGIGYSLMTVHVPWRRKKSLGCSDRSDAWPCRGDGLMGAAPRNGASLFHSAGRSRAHSDGGRLTIRWAERLDGTEFR